MGEFSSVETLLKTQNLKLKDVTYFHDITFCSTYTKEKIHESSPEFEVVSVLKRNLARPFFFPPLTTVFRILGDEEEDDVHSERVCIFLERLSF